MGWARGDINARMRGDTLRPHAARASGCGSLLADGAVAGLGGIVGPPGWPIHLLRVDWAGTWSISVGGNWRLTFDIRQGEIRDLDWKDYH
jgi:hypothetical protein